MLPCQEQPNHIFGVEPVDVRELLESPDPPFTAARDPGPRFNSCFAHSDFS